MALVAPVAPVARARESPKPLGAAVATRRLSRSFRPESSKTAAPLAPSSWKFFFFFFLLALGGVNQIFL